MGHFAYRDPGGHFGFEWRDRQTDTLNMLQLLASAGLVLAVSASPVLYLQESGAEVHPRMRREAEAQFVVSSPYVIPATYASPAVTFAAPNVVKAPTVVNAPSAVNTSPNVAFKPTMYSANPVAVADPAANPEPFLFSMFGGGGYGMNGGSFFDNNLGGKADYGNYGYRRYPSYGDYYRTHRYPINDGWMLWDEDLRDLDSKSNKIGK